MQEVYIAKEKNKDKNEKENNMLLVKNLIETYNNIDVARKNYEFADGDLIDYYLYEIKANQSKLNYLIKKSKKNGIEVDRIEKMQMINQEENQVI